MKARLAAVESVFSAASVARTSKVCRPSESGIAGVWLAPGPEQAPKGSESKRHSKVECGSLEEKLKVGMGSVVAPTGPALIVV